MIGDLFARLEQILGTVLSFYYDFLDGFMSHGNAYGLSIILLTITINIVVFPLTLKQTRSTRAFQEIQPKIKKIQAEYKDDPQEMQRRLMETQREAGATPGGCLLPLLVQMPIWFALFRLLRTPIIFLTDADGQITDQVDPNAIHPIDPNSALGQSLLDADPETFLGMQLDTSPSQAMADGGLSQAWPYLIMMLIMIAAQYIQQWHSTYGQVKPSGPGAGSQQMITRIMPLFIGFISYNFPAGLLVYWTTSNLFRLGQQVLIFRMEGRPTRPGDQEDSTKSTGSDEDDSTDQAEKKPQQGSAKKRRRRRRS